MNNFTVLWEYKPFKSKEDARKYCISDECERHISYLDGLSYSLREQGLTEPKVSQGHGYPEESASSFEAAHVSNEANRLRRMRRYFKGEAPSPGCKWEYSTHGLHSVYEKIDLKNATMKHPVFLEYIKEQNISKSEKKEAFKIWYTAHRDGGVNNYFKLQYHFKLKELIPEDTVLLKMVKKKS